MLALDADLGVLVEAIDPETGEFDTVGPIDMVFDRCAELKVGRNADGTVNIFAVILTAAGNLAVTLDPPTGVAKSLGLVADNDSPIQGIAWHPDQHAGSGRELPRRANLSALTQSRRTVRASTPTTSAISSSLYPPKNRHSTTWDNRASRSASLTSASSSASTLSARSAGGERRLVQAYRAPVATAFLRPIAPGIVHENPAHRPRGEREEVPPILILHPVLVHEAEVGLVDQSRRPQGVLLALGAELPVSHPPELLVDQRKQPVECGTVARAQLEQEVGNRPGIVVVEGHRRIRCGGHGACDRRVAVSELVTVEGSV